MNHLFKQLRLRLFPFYILSATAVLLSAKVDPHPDRGVALIWYGEQDNLDDRDGVVSVGQIFLMWQTFEPEPGKYQLEALAEELRRIKAKGMKATVQINGNIHPDHLYEHVPYLKEVHLPTQQDSRRGFGPPIYWHPAYKQRHEALVRTIAEFLLASPDRDAVLGIRQSYNAVGTEHMHIPPEYRNPSAWTWPEGIEEPGVIWTDEVKEAYQRWVMDLYVDAFNPPQGIPVFVRASLIGEQAISPQILKMVENGELGIFHTSTDPQPQNVRRDAQFSVFLDYAKTGKTYAFMESWATVTKSAPRWKWERTQQPISESQYNLWVLLCDLHCGATFPAMRPEEVNRPEFRDDYVFAARYAGTQPYPELAPGAWIAFREGDFLVGDYSLFIKRTSENDLPLYNVDDSPYGLWARELPAGKTMTLEIDPAFSDRLPSSRHGAEIRIIYKDEAEGSFRIDALGQEGLIEKTSGTGNWKTVRFQIREATDARNVRITADRNNLILHRLEVALDHKS